MPKSEKLTKSRERVQKFGEVFTPVWVVNKMCDELPADAWDIDKTILEPACGNGNFLVKIFSRKLEKCNTPDKGLKALKSIYGVDILPDNVIESRHRLMMMYLQQFGFVPQYKAAIEIIANNIIQADFLKLAPVIKQAKSWDEVWEYAPQTLKE